MQSCHTEPGKIVPDSAKGYSGLRSAKLRWHLKKIEIFVTVQYPEVETGLKPMRMKVKCILKKGIGSDWIWPIFRRGGNRLATNENEGWNAFLKKELVQTGSGQYSEKM
jgi:hypothetical protein